MPAAGSGLTVSFGENATAQVARAETEEVEEGEPGGIEADNSSSDSDDDAEEKGALVRTGRSR